MTPYAYLIDSKSYACLSPDEAGALANLIEADKTDGVYKFLAAIALVSSADGFIHYDALQAAGACPLIGNISHEHGTGFIALLKSLAATGVFSRVDTTLHHATVNLEHPIFTGAARVLTDFAKVYPTGAAAIIKLVHEATDFMSSRYEAPTLLASTYPHITEALTTRLPKVD